MAKNPPLTRRQFGSREFQLEQLTRLDPERLLARDGSDRFQALMLALALVYNDLKGIELWAEWWSSYRRPGDDEVTSHAGEHRGINLQIHRFAVGLIRELLELLLKHRDVVETDKFKELAQRAGFPKDIERAWQDLQRVALDAKARRKDAFSNTLERIRHNVAFHYYQPDMLVAGYRLHFYGRSTVAANENAFASFGRDMESTRFYYADAAVSGALDLIQGADPKFPERVHGAKRLINQVLQALLDAYTREARR